MLENFTAILAVMATAYGVAMAIANFPQAYKIAQKKSCADVSILTYIILFPGTVIWVLYGISLNNFPIISTNLLSMLSIVSVFVVYYIYKK